MNPGRICLGVVLLSFLAAPGCSGSGNPVKVEGIVTLDGKPLPDAGISLTPEDGHGPPASGMSGADGTFRLTTFSSGDGAFPGTYKVIVSLGEPENEGAKTMDPKDAKGMMDMMKKVKEEKKTKKHNLPASYSDPKKSSLKQVIPPPNGKMTLELRSTGG